LNISTPRRYELHFILIRFKKFYQCHHPFNENEMHISPSFWNTCHLGIWYHFYVTTFHNDNIYFLRLTRGIFRPYNSYVYASYFIFLNYPYHSVHVHTKVVPISHWQQRISIKYSVHVHWYLIAGWTCNKLTIYHIYLIALNK
jgi:hypothetical protein